MNNFKFYVILTAIFLFGIYPAFAYAFLQKDVYLMTISSTIKWNKVNDIFYFFAVAISFYFLQRSKRIKRDFKIVILIYGISSLIYDDLLVRATGFLFLLLFMFKIYLILFPKDFNMIHKIGE